MAIYKTNSILEIKGYTIELCLKLDVKVVPASDPGVNTLKINYVGNVTNYNNTKLLPLDIVPSDQGFITIDGNVKGNFVFESVQRTRWKKIENKVGQTVKGYLIPAKPPTEANEWV